MGGAHEDAAMVVWQEAAVVKTQCAERPAADVQPIPKETMKPLKVEFGAITADNIEQVRCIGE